ncbi:hypothetical protein ACS0TY_016874 [Phlomoides rotata]
MAKDKLKWLKSWLKLPFYKEKCRKHVKHYLTFYCIDCESLMCKLCWDKKSSQHPDRQVLEVTTASRRPAIKVRKINKCLDISHIREYKINGDQVVYLNPCEKEKEFSNSNYKHVCKGRLNDPGSPFCSIACKINTMNMEVNVELNLPREKESDANEMMAEDDIQLPIVKSDEKRWPNKCGSFRRRSRKGIPLRAPLF